ncbi:MAG: DUF3631 domain-containing protein [Chloroflexi bacterium]|nr:DUF3631 domain-containing protein [Chloroflexota bacterium]
MREYRGALVLSLRDVDGELHSLQFIGADGAKRFLTGGHIAGCVFTVADKPDGPLVMAEGYATAASIHEATTWATVAAMNCGNLLAVAQALRRKWPDRDIVIAADNDQFTDGNPGVTKATEAAKAIGARLAVPQFKDTSTRPTDINDLAILEGFETVKTQIESASVPTESDAETFDRLAKLPPADYDRARDAEAKRLGIRVGTLDGEVATRRPAASDCAQGGAVELPDIEPWPEPVDGAEVLNEVAATFTRYIVLPHGAADALALWTAHAHALEAFIHTPRLNLYSPEKGCGKTTALDVLASVTPRPLRTESMTAAVLFRLVERCKPTLLLDEVDAYLNEAEELRGLLNAGHKRGARAYRCEGEKLEVRGFSAFAPAALAGIGALPGTLHDRSVVVRLTRAKPGEVAARFDSRRTAGEIELCRKLVRWTADHREQLEAADPILPDGAFNRLADNWRPLFAIAEAAGADWPRRAAEAFAKLTTSDDLDSQGIGATLLADIAAVFAAAGADKLPSAKLAGALAEIEGRPWAEFGKNRRPISANQLANQLRRFGVTPRAIRIGDETPRGYTLADFQEAFDRFMPKLPLSECNSATNPENTGENAVSEAQHLKTVLRPENGTSANKDAACCTVAVQKPPTDKKQLAEALLL